MALALRRDDKRKREEADRKRIVAIVAEERDDW